MANDKHVELVHQGREALHQWRNEHPDMRLDLREADLRGANLRGADLCEANLSGAILFGVNLFGAILFVADLREADLRGANLSGADLNEANLHGAILSEANLQDTNLRGVRGATRARGMETIRLEFLGDDQDSTTGHGKTTTGNDVRYFDTCDRPLLERWLDWERLRTVGRLPLFGVSYSILILIPVVFYFLALYNKNVVAMSSIVKQILSSLGSLKLQDFNLPETLLQEVGDKAQTFLQPHPIPRQSFLLLASTILLAIGSTLYTFFCPSRVKEFSRDQWCDQLGRSLLHYWSLAWKNRPIRLLCTICYALGGAGALWIIGTKVWGAIVFIYKNSAFSWL